MRNKWKRPVTERESPTSVTSAPLISMGLLNSLSTMGLNPSCAVLRQLSDWSIDMSCRTSVAVGCILVATGLDLHDWDRKGPAHIDCVC